MIYLLILLYVIGAINALILYKMSEYAGYKVEKGYFLAVAFWPIIPLWTVYNLIKDS